jgi:hypothetical protein
MFQMYIGACSNLPVQKVVLNVACLWTFYMLRLTMMIGLSKILIKLYVLYRGSAFPIIRQYWGIYNLHFKTIEI